MTAILSGSRLEICSSRALTGASSTFAGIRPRSRSAPVALSRYCIGLLITTSFMALLPGTEATCGLPVATKQGLAELPSALLYFFASFLVYGQNLLLLDGV